MSERNIPDSPRCPYCGQPLPSRNSDEDWTVAIHYADEHAGELLDRPGASIPVSAETEARIAAYNNSVLDFVIGRSLPNPPKR